MTFKEKLAQEYPCAINENDIGGCVGCPVSYGYEKQRPSCCDVRKIPSDEMCSKCWNREIPETKVNIPTEPTETQLTKYNLKVGQIVCCRNEELRLVLQTTGGKMFLAGNYSFVSLDNFHDNLLSKGGSEYDIMYVLSIRTMDTTYDMLEKYADEEFDLIWERTETKTMSISDAEEMLEKLTGKKVKIK